MRLQIRQTAFALMLLAGAAAQAAPFQNGSFENGTLVNTASFDELHIGSTAITGWTVLGPAGVDYAQGLWQPADGLRSLDLVGCDFQGGGQGGIEQTFDTIPGATYGVTFAMAGNSGNAPTIKSLAVTAAGNSKPYSFDTTGHSNASMGWVTNQFAFVATGSSTTLRFDNTSDSSGCGGAALDDVHVALLDAPVQVPVQDAALPAALALMLAGAFALQRRRRGSPRA